MTICRSGLLKTSQEQREEGLAPEEVAGGGNPGELFGEDFAGGFGVDEGLGAPFVAPLETRGRQG